LELDDIGNVRAGHDLGGRVVEVAVSGRIDPAIDPGRS